METWKTSEGDEIPLSKMTDSHLRNAYAYLGRRLESNVLKDDPVHDVSEVEFAPNTDADGTAEFATAVAEMRVRADADKAWMVRLRTEAARRGLELS